MQQLIVKFTALSYWHCSTCFRHYNAHHQEPVKLQLQPLVSVWMWRWKCCCVLGVVFEWLKMHGTTNLKFINAKQAGYTYTYRNIKQKLHKMIAAIRFNETCRTLPPPHSYGNQRLQRQFHGLLMMGIVMP